MKTYTYDSTKYSGGLRMFMKHCDLSGVTRDDMPRAFALMLIGTALDYYYSHLEGTATDIDEMVSKVKMRFMTQER